MSHFRYTILFVLLISFMGTSNLMASPHHHEGHDLGVLSPFDKEPKSGALHCFLKNHQHGNNFCPHSKKLEKAESYYLSSYCGGKSTGAFPSFSFHKENIDNSSFNLGLSNISFLLSAQLFLPTQQTLNFSEPPPKVL